MPNPGSLMVYDYASATNTVLPGGTGASGAKFREDVTDIVVNIAPFETPLWSSVMKVPVNHTYHEWIEDTLTTTNAATGLAEGHAFTASAINIRSRLGNVTEIFGKDIEVSNTVRAISMIGIDDEYMYQVEIALKEIARAIETRFFSSASTMGQGTTAAPSRTMRPLNGFITTNTVSACNVALGHDKASLDQLLESIFSAGGVPDTLYCPPRSKTFYSTELAGFTASWNSAAGLGSPLNTRNIAAAASVLEGNIDVYRSNFNTIRLIPNRFMPTATAAFSATSIMKVFAIESPRVQVGILRPIEHSPLPPAGDSTRGMIVGELTLKVLAEAAHGKIINLKTATV